MFYLALVLIRTNIAMPSIDDIRDAGDVIDVVGINNTGIKLKEAGQALMILKKLTWN